MRTAVSLSCLTAALLVGGATSVAGDETEWNEMVTALRRAGRPVTLREVEARFDGAALLADAERWLNEPPDDAVEIVAWLPRLVEDADRAELLSFRNRLGAFREPFRLVEEALQRPAITFKRLHDPAGYSPLIMYDVGKLLQLRALMAAAEGDGGRAAAYLSDLAEIGRRRPDILRGAAAGLVAGTTRRIVSVSMVRRDTLRNVLEPVLERAPRPYGPETMVELDIARTIDVIDRWSRGERIAERVDWMSFSKVTGWRPEWQPDAETKRRVRASVVRYVAAAQDMIIALEENPRAAWRLDGSPFRESPLAEEMRVTARGVILGPTELNLVRVGLACLAYEERHGAWPETLSKLREMFRGGVPDDVAGGGEFFYSRLDDGGVRIASAGGEWYTEPPTWTLVADS